MKSKSPTLAITEAVSRTMDEQIELTDDAFLGGALQILQPKRGYRAGVDPVLLAAAIPAVKGESVLDVGAGVGTASLCLLRRVAGVRVSALEIQELLASIARENAQRNELSDSFDPIQGDAFDPPRSIKEQSFDHVMTNPPYYKEGSGMKAPNDLKATSNMGPDDLLPGWIDLCVKRLKPRGRLTIIHRVDAMTDILSLLQGRVGAVRVFPIWSSEGKPANRVIISGIQDSRAALSLEQGLIMHEPNTRYSQAAEEILRHGKALEIG